MIRLISLVAACVLVLSCSGAELNGVDAPLLMDQTLAASDSRIAVVGRTEVLSNGALRFGYPGVSLQFTFRGHQLEMLADSSHGRNYIELSVDGDVKKILIPKEPTLISLYEGDDLDEHSIRLFHSSETWHGLVTLQTFVINGGELSSNAISSTRKIVFIGDSITCGEAIDRPNSLSTCGAKQPLWWNPRLSYGMLMAQALDASAQLVCMGGRGLIRSWDGNMDEPQAPEFYDLSVVSGSDSVVWEHFNYQADLVFISLGTNDFSHSAGVMPSFQQYVPSYVRLVNKILDDHPASKVVLTEGPLLSGVDKDTLASYLEDIKKTVASDRVSVIRSIQYPGDDCDFHPTKEQHQHMAEDFIPQIKAIMKW